MNKEYSNRLESLKARRFDQDLNESVLNNGFFNQDYPDALKYTLETFKGLDSASSYKAFSSVKRTQDLIQQQLRNINIKVDARYTGPHTTDTHLELYGDIDLFIILQSYEGKASQNVAELSSEIMDILNKAQAYNKVDNSDKQSIIIQIRKPICTLRITPAIWVNSSLYQKSSVEINRGICEYNFESKTRKIHMPFLNMARINNRDKNLDGNLKAASRLLRTLVKDAEQPINLSDDELMGITYNISVDEMRIDPNKRLSLLPNISLAINRLITDDTFRKQLLSPSKHEYVFGNKDKSAALIALKTELDEITEDLKQALQPMNKSLMSAIEY
jgi:hypothetical protein